ncbi:branched-chain amino acid transaminase [bacterium]|nr:branched-chain amino acid transaminase [bacterium]
MIREFVYIDNKFVKKEDAKISVMTHGFLYGTSVFEGIRAYYNKDEHQMYAFRLEEHFERFIRSAKVMHIDIGKSVEELCDITKELLKKNNYHTDVYIRPTAYKSHESVRTHMLDGSDGLIIFSVPLGETLKTNDGLEVCVSNWRRTCDNAIPPSAKIGGAYANTALVATDAKLAGFDEAVTLSENGDVMEGSTMNLFLVIDGKLVTTASNCGILEGITRNTIIELAKNNGIPVEQRRVQRSELYYATEAFFCGTSAQICVITSIDKRPVGTGKIGKISSMLQKEYFDAVHGLIPQYKKWCSKIYD